MSWALEQASYDELAQAVAFLQSLTKPEDAVPWADQILNAESLDLPGLERRHVSVAYALAFLQGAADVGAPI